MLRLLADENLNDHVFRTARRCVREIDVVRARDVGLSGADDPTVLAWAASERRLVISNDRRTMSPYAYDRIAEGKPMPGLLIVRPGFTVAELVDDLLVLASQFQQDDFDGQVRWVPLSM